MKTLLGALFSAILMMVPGASAQDSSKIDTCAIPLIGCASGSDVASFIQITFVAPFLSVIFPGLLLAMLIYYGLNLLFKSEEEKALTEARQSYEYAIAGTVLVLLCAYFAEAFANTGTEIVNPTPVTEVIGFLVVFIKGVVTAALIAMMTFQGFVLITAQEDGDHAKARKGLLHSMIGVAVVLLAGVIVDMFARPNTSPGMLELKGIANFLITIFGFLAVVGIMVGGIMLIISVDESLKDKAKKLILACVIATLIVVCSGILINFFLLAQ